LMSRVLHIQRAVTHATHHEETLELIAKMAGEMFGSDSIAVRRVDNPSGRSLWTVNIDSDFAQTIPLIDPKLGISRRAMDENSIVIDRDYRPLHLPDQGRTVSAIAAPIYCQGETVGAMTVLAGPDRDEPHTEEDQEALIILAGYVSVAITKAAATEELERSLLEAQWRASHDHLTGLPNRARIIEIIEAQLSQGLTPVVLYIDFDGFKSVNDLYGHVTGDLALIAVSERLALMLRAGESIARLAGDEFVALLPPGSDQDALAVAKRIVEKLAKPLDVAGRDLVLPASVGIANIAATSAEELLEAADLAMYRAKSLPSESIAFFDSALRQDRTRRVLIEQQLRLSLVNMASFTLNFQPIVEGPEFEVCAYEALLRWDTAAAGVVSPDEFVPVAEETGIISQIDEWVLATALRESGLLSGGKSRVSVNLSAASFLRGYLPSLVERILVLSGTPASRLAIEITERVMLGDSQLVRHNIGALRDLGVAVVLDDFGVGYSSLSYLQDLEIDGLKIDRSFVQGATGDRRGAAVLRAVLSLAADLGIETVAEGVETREQLELLQSLGCSHFQGYFFGRPAPVDQLMRQSSEIAMAGPLVEPR
ncbi:MAG: bifunctional diguanylate cyclase/phosphodiesterase, partial [Acidimicrobiales bacterium]